MKLAQFLMRSLAMRYVVILLYYLTAIFGLIMLDWTHFTWVSGLITFYVALWIADFAIGVVHLYIDYLPLNFAQGFGLLYAFKGDRASDEFNQLKHTVMTDSHWLDRKVYSFKMHHRNGSSNKNTPYSELFFEFFIPSLIFLLSAVCITLVLGEFALATHIAFFDIVFSLFAIHAQYIHYAMHGSNQLKMGNSLVKFLSDAKLIYSYETHAIHHRDGHTGFCFIAGHANFAVNWLCKKLLERGAITAEDWHGRLPSSK